MLQEFLNLQFIQTTDDANFDKLKKACTDVVKKIGKEKTAGTGAETKFNDKISRPASQTQLE